jgi:hypothetical protein
MSAPSTIVRSKPAVVAAPKRLSPSRALALPLTTSLALAAFALLPAARANARLSWSILGAAAFLLAGVFALRARASGRSLFIDVQLRPQHYLQACAQGIVLLYWGYYWRPVYDALPLLAAQLVFAYSFDMLLAWSRRDTYTLGFAPFPVIFSINLFLWFKPDWFYLQFLMIAVGFAAKELIRWNKEGRLAHIFNPSSFPLAVFSLALIATGTTDITYGVDIARTQFNPPGIYLLLFLIGLPGQLLFGVTTMTMSAVVTTYLFGLAYYKLTGTYYFVDSYIPVAVFLGMHLLFTDPSTSPRTELGRILFGVLYGLGNIVLYAWLLAIGAPAFYDKLLPVPILNLSIKLIDRVARLPWLRVIDPARLAPALAGRRRNLAYVAVWTGVFITLSAVDGVGDHHPGHRVTFWQRACQADAPNGCETLAVILETYCTDGSGWACNELGALRWHGRVSQPRSEAAAAFARGCGVAHDASCQNLIISKGAAPPRQVPPRLQDYPVILRTGKGPLPDRSPTTLLTLACEQEFATGCEDLGRMFLTGEGATRDQGRAAGHFRQACDLGLATACSNLGLMQYRGDGIPKDVASGKSNLQRACELGLERACRWFEETP